MKSKPPQLGPGLTINPRASIVPTTWTSNSFALNSSQIYKRSKNSTRRWLILFLYCPSGRDWLHKEADPLIYSLLILFEFFPRSTCILFLRLLKSINLDSNVAYFLLALLKLLASTGFEETDRKGGFYSHFEPLNLLAW